MKDSNNCKQVNSNAQDPVAPYYGNGIYFIFSKDGQTNEKK